jgi:hypothetical protein
MEAKKNQPSLVAIYLLLLAVFLAAFQMHASWGYDPILSYSVAGWGTSALGFFYLGLLFASWKRPSNAMKRRLWVAAIMGTVGFLVYEMFLAFAAAGAVMLLLSVIRKSDEEGFRTMLRPLSLAVGLPLGVFAITQLVRLRIPNWYDGTSFGYLDWVLPTTITSTLSTTPLANALPYREEVGSYAPWDESIGLHVFIIVLSFLLGMWMLMETELPRQIANYERFVAAGALGVVLIGSNMVFAVSEKYQFELGNRLGYVYLGYAPGLLSLAVLLGWFSVLITQRLRRIGVVACVSALVLVAIPQAGINQSIENDLRNRWSWSSDLVNALRHPVDEKQRCSLAKQLDTAVLPEGQKASVAEGLTLAYAGRNSGEPFCRGWRELPNRSVGIVLRE